MAEESGTAVAESPADIAESPATEVVPAPGSPTVPLAEPVIPEPVPPVAPRPEGRQEPPPSPTRERPPERQSETPEAKTTPEVPDTLHWRTLADPEIRNDPVLGKYETVGEALKALVHLSHLQGRSIQIPPENAGDAQKRVVYEKLGCPSDPMAYQVQEPDMGQEEDGEARRMAPSFMDSLLRSFHEAMLAPWQAQILVDFCGRQVVQGETLRAGQAAMEEAERDRQLYTAFGADSATMLQKAAMTLAKLGEGRYGGGQYAREAVEKWRNSSLGRDVSMVALLANMWENLGEGQFIESSLGGGVSSRDQIEADMAQLASIFNDESKPMEERLAAQKKHFALAHDVIAMQEAAERRQAIGRR